MRKAYLIVAGLFIATSALAQKDNILRNPTEIPVTFHGETVPLRDYVEDPSAVNEITKTLKEGYHPKEDWILNENVNPLAKPNGDDPAWQRDYAPNAVNSKSLAFSFEGIGFTGVSPSDRPLMSVSRICDQGMSGIFEKTHARVVDSDGKTEPLFNLLWLI